MRFDTSGLREKTKVVARAAAERGDASFALACHLLLRRMLDMTPAAMRFRREGLAAWLTVLLRELDEVEADAMVAELAVIDAVLPDLPPARTLEVLLDLAARESLAGRAADDRTAVEVAATVYATCPCRRLAVWKRVVTMAQAAVTRVTHEAMAS